MLNLLHLRYRGDYYEIAYDRDNGSVVEVILFPCDGRRGEPLSYFDLPDQLQNRIQDELSRLNLTSPGSSEKGS